MRQAHNTVEVRSPGDEERAHVRGTVASPVPPMPVTRIRPSRGWARLQLDELWEYRELLYFLAWRDIKVRYKQTALGATWAVIQPFLTMVAFSVFFGNLAKVPSDGVPYPIFSYVALLPWTLFTYALTQSSNSLVGNANLLSKVYFPRLVVPLASVVGGVLDFGVSFVVLVGMMVFYRMPPSPAVVLLPVLLLLTMLAALGAGVWLSALNVEYRDVRYVIPFLTQFWLFITPVAYPSSLLAEPWRTLLGINPMAGVIEAFRWALLGTALPGAMLLLSVGVSLLVLVTGAFYFRRMEKSFADVV